MFLVHKKGLVLDGNNPTLMYGYGGFNIATTPGFNSLRIALLRQFVVAVDTLQQQAQAGANPGGMANPDAGFVPQPQGQLQAGLPQNEAPQGAAVLGVG